MTVSGRAAEQSREMESKSDFYGARQVFDRSFLSRSGRGTVTMDEGQGRTGLWCVDLTVFREWRWRPWRRVGGMGAGVV